MLRIGILCDTISIQYNFVLLNFTLIFNDLLILFYKFWYYINI